MANGYYQNYETQKIKAVKRQVDLNKLIMAVEKCLREIDEGESWRGDDINILDDEHIYELQRTLKEVKGG